MLVPRTKRKSGRIGSRWIRFGTYFVLSTAVPGTAMRAAEHPVPLGNKPDTTRCIGCHADKTKGKHAHFALAAWCTACPAVTQAHGVTTINLVAPSKELCFSCHAKSNEKVSHGPYGQGNCVVCHSPHSSNWTNQLLAPTQDPCMGCHVRARLKVNAKRRTAKVPWGATLTFDQPEGWQCICLDKELLSTIPSKDIL